MKTKTLLFVAVYLPIAYCLLPTYLFAQTPGEWTWVHGDNTPNSPGVFGTQGVFNTANTPPALYEVCEWKDNSGNFWLLGGSGAGNNLYAALWKYNPTTNQWAWMKGPSVPNQPCVYGTQGISSPANHPGARGLGSITWVDDSGNLWLFGGNGYTAIGGSGLLNDLWKYDILASEWTWMKGTNTINSTGSYGTQGISDPSNIPPSRYETSCSWTVSTDNLWLYGGVDQSGISFRRGDLWRYDISTNEWIWMHGANTVNPPAVYGTQGAVAPANTPGGRMVYCSWTDLAGNLWLFGGRGVSTGLTNDLWKYDIIANQWTWMKGPATTNDPGNYGAKCISTNSNMPPARMENRARVRDACGNFWNFGGGVSGPSFNDLWHYNVSTNQWTWVSGDNITYQATVYGVQGVSSPANKPGAKIGSVAWIDNNGYIWVFGGSGNSGYFNDLFRYVPDTNCTPCTISVSLSATVSSTGNLCNGQCTGTAIANLSGGVSPFSYSWNTTPAQTTQIVTGLCTGSYTVTVTDAGGATATATVTITQPSAITSTTNSTPAPSGTATINPSGGIPPYTYVWNTIPPQTTQTATGLAAGVYCCTITDANNCTDTACVTVTIEPIDCSNVGELYLPNAFSPNNDGENDKLQIYYGNIACIRTFKLVIYNRWGEKVFETTNPVVLWDGTYREKIEDTAVFVYYMKVTLLSGEEIMRKGNVSLIR